VISTAASVRSGCVRVTPTSGVKADIDPLTQEAERVSIERIETVLLGEIVAKSKSVRLNAPSNITFLISLVVAGLAILGAVVHIPFISVYAFWIAIIAYRAGPACLNRFSASISGSSAGLSCQAEGQRGEVGLIWRLVVKARMRPPSVVEVQVAAERSAGVADAVVGPQ
jgi:hypothetical protein